MFNISCPPSSAQGDRDLETSREGDGKRVQGDLREKYRQLLQEMKNKGYDVSEASALNEKARRAAREGNRQEMRQLLEQAIAKLESLEAGTHRAANNEGTLKSRIIEIPMGVKEVHVTKTVPDYESGRDIKDYHSAFKTEKISVRNGKLSIKLTSLPVFIEPADRTSKNVSLNSADSPFGVAFAGFVKDGNVALSHMKDLGASWVRFLGPWGGAGLGRC